MFSIRFSSRVGENVDYMENLEFSSLNRAEISTRYTELKFLHVNFKEEFII